MHGDDGWSGGGRRGGKGSVRRGCVMIMVVFGKWKIKEQKDL
jgi:hypothetical protein